MAANTGTVNIRLRVKDDGSVVVERFGKNMEDAGRRAESGMSKAGASLMSLKSALAGIGFGLAVKGLWDIGLESQRLEKSFGAIAGDSKTAANELAFLRAKADELGLEFYRVADAYKGIYAAAQTTNLSAQQTRDIFTGVMTAATALALPVENVEGILRAMSQMMSKGKVSAEELTGQLGEHLPGALGEAANAMHMSTAQLMSMMSKGELMAVNLLPKLADALQKKYGKAAIDASQGAEAAWNRMVTAFKDGLSELSKSGFMDMAVDSIRDMTTRLVNLSTWIENNGESVDAFFRSLTATIKGLGQIGEWTGKLVGWLPGWASDLGAALGMVAGGAISLKDVASANREELRDIVKSFDMTPMLITLKTQKDQLETEIDDLRGRLDVSSFTKNISSVLTPDFLPGLQKELDSKISQINAINSQISALYAPKNKPPGWNNKTDSNSKGPGLPPVSPPEAAIKKRTEKDPKDLGDAHVKAYQDELRNRMDSYIEFQDEYKKLTLSSFALESMEIDALGNKYIQAGADKIQVDAWVAYEKAAIRTAELEDEREKAEERLRASQYWADGAIRGLQDYAAQASDAASSVESMFTNAFSNLEDALVNFVMTGKLSFSDLVNSMIADIVRLSIQQSITAPLASALASGMSSVFGGWAGTGTGSYSSADGSMSSTFATYNKFGNAFGHDGIHPFAKGGAFTNRIYNQPTPFMFGSGGAFGVMGEAGDEAVMPLARTSSGELGVKSSGSSPVINVTINNQASGATGRVASSSPNGSGGMDLTVIIEQIDGAIASGIGTGRSATASALEGTYGLNRAYGAMR